MKDQKRATRSKIKTKQSRKSLYPASDRAKKNEKNERNDRKRKWLTISSLFLGLLAACLILPVLFYGNIVHLVYVQCENPSITLDLPVVANGEIESQPLILKRGESVRLVSQGERYSRIRAGELLADVPNATLSHSLESALTPKKARLRHAALLYKNRNGSEISGLLPAGSEVHVTDLSLMDYDEKNGLVCWYKVECDGQSGYVHGQALDWEELSDGLTPHTDHKNADSKAAQPSADPHQQDPERTSSSDGALLHASVTENSLSSGNSDPASSSFFVTDLRNDPQPVWNENRQPEELRALNIDLENLIVFPEQVEKYLKETGLNALIVTLKDVDGLVCFESETVDHAFMDDSARHAQHEAALLTRNELKDLVSLWKSKGICMIGRMEAFADDALAAQHPDLAYSDQNAPLQEDCAWLAPDNPDVWFYLSSLAREAASCGFEEIQLDSVRYPEQEGEVSQTEGSNRIAVIQNFLLNLREDLEEYHAYVSATVIPSLGYDPSDPELGQDLEVMKKACRRIYLCPYLISLQSLPANYGIEVFSNAHDVILGYVQQSLSSASDPSDADLVYSLQGFGLMSPETLHAQLQGLSDGHAGSYAINTIYGHPDQLLPLQSAFDR